MSCIARVDGLKGVFAGCEREDRCRLAFAVERHLRQLAAAIDDAHDAGRRQAVGSSYSD